jgi:DNA repair protein RecN (Recombination protein N)
MISELRVRELGVISDVSLVLRGGLTAITGETGAGKTLIVEALELLVGGKSDAAMVRAGAEETTVEGRFVSADEEVILSRVIPRAGRSRALIDAKMAPLAALEEIGRDLIDLYGQHAHQSLLRPSAQRAALDGFAGVDLRPVRAVRARLAEIDQRIASLGGDARARQRELDLLTFELGEITAAAISGPDEDAQLAVEEDELAAATALREAATVAYDLLEGTLSPGVLDLLGQATEALGRHSQLDEHRARLRSVAADLTDAAGELRHAAERFEENPERLAEVRARRQLLARLVKKHGDTLTDVIAAGIAARDRIAELDATDAARAELEAERAERVGELAAAEGLVGDQRRAAAGALGSAIEGHLHSLALGGARLEVVVPATGIGDDVEFRLAANPGEPALALAKVASGGELARAMLALRLVLTAAPPTLVFDEVDAGIGGEAAIAVGRALSRLAATHQVLVVTHLAQVAAFADHQLVVDKREETGRTVARVRAVEGEERVIELSRMLSGHPDSTAARTHAAELLATAAADRKS